MLLGIAAFFVFCGWWVLIPTNISWLETGDRAMHQLGWMFYRDAPWGIPPGANPNLGLELASSIALVDGLPLFAMPFKLVAQWLPQPFQYWGYWLLLSFTLQSVFAWRIARELGAGRLVALLAAAFVLITPTYLFRIPLHLALSSHWVVLAALLLNVRQVPPKGWMWPLLAAITAAIHATLLAMVLALWAASAVERLWTKRTPFLSLLGEAAALGVAVLAVLWAVGFFGTGSYGASGYGAYKLNLLWPIISHGWSQIFPDLDHTRYDYEGLGFLGIGILALLVVALVNGGLWRAGRAAIAPRWLPLTLMLLALMVFAFSKNLSALDHDLIEIEMPGFVEAIGSAFRSTGRFVWPILYLVTIGAVVLAAARLRALIAVPLLLAAFIGQAIDSQPKWHEFASKMPKPAPVWRTAYVSPFWERAAAAGYERIRAIPVKRGGYGGEWKDPGYYAVTHGMATDMAYLARVDAEAIAALRARSAEILVTGDFEPRTLYVLDLLSALTAAAHAGPDDLLAEIDGQLVFARGGKALAEGLDLVPVMPAN